MSNDLSSNSKDLEATKLATSVKNEKRLSYLEFINKFALASKRLSKVAEEPEPNRDSVGDSKAVIMNEQLASQNKFINIFLSKCKESLSLESNHSNESSIIQVINDCSENIDNSRDIMVEMNEDISEKSLKPRAINSTKNVHDSIEDDSSDYEEKSPFIISKNSRFKWIWDNLMMLCMSYIIIVTPVRLAFNSSIDSSIEKLIEVLIDLLLCCDLGVNFFMSYDDAKGNEIFVRSKVIKHYFYSWFLFDLVSSFPFSTIQIIGFEGTESIFSISKVFRLYRIIKWLRVIRILKMISTKFSLDSKAMTNFNKVVSMLVLIFIFFVLIHSFSCILIFIGYEENVAGWIEINDFSFLPPSELYVVSFYFHIVTMLTVGYGDIKMESITERTYTCFFLCIGIFIYSCTITFSSNYFSRLNLRKQKYSNKMKILNEIDKQYKLNTSLFDKIAENIKQEYKRVILERYMLLETLPTKYRNDLIYKMHSDHIDKLDFLRGQTHDFIIAVLPLMKPLKLVKNDVLFTVGDYVEEMYLVTNGKLSLEVDVTHHRMEVAQIRKNYHFGEYQMYENMQSNYMLRNKILKTELLVLKRKDFNEIRIDFSENFHLIIEKSLKLLEIIEKRTKLIESLFNYAIEPKEIKVFLKEIDDFILRKGFETLFYDDVNFETLKDKVLKENYDEILKAINLKAGKDSSKLEKAQLRLQGEFIKIEKQSELREKKENLKTIVSNKNEFGTFFQEKLNQHVSLSLKDEATIKEDSELEIVSVKEETQVHAVKQTSSKFLMKKAKKAVTTVKKAKQLNLYEESKSNFSFSIKATPKVLAVQRVFSETIVSTKEQKDRKKSKFEDKNNTIITSLAKNIALASRKSVYSRDYLRYHKEAEVLADQTKDLMRTLSKASLNKKRGFSLRSIERGAKEKVNSDDIKKVNISSFLSESEKRNQNMTVELNNRLTGPVVKTKFFKKYKDEKDLIKKHFVDYSYRLENKLDKIMKKLKEMT